MMRLLCYCLITQHHAPHQTILICTISFDLNFRYHAHVYTNGTVCDLTNQPRETEVRVIVTVNLFSC